MASLVYSALMSLDGFLEDETGSFEWATPDAEVHQFANELDAGIGTHLYGRRMYETMAVWETIDRGPDVHPAEVAYAEQWRALDKIVFSTTLESVWTPRTTLERRFDPDAITDLKRSARRDISISGPGLASHAFAAGLVDEMHLFAFPIAVGGGKRALPAGQRVEFELLDSHIFESGVVHTHLRSR